MDKNMMPQNDDNHTRAQLIEGLLYIHGRINANTASNLEARSYLYALVELLAEADIITFDQLDERKKIVNERLAKRLRDNGDGVVLQTPEQDKYTFESAPPIDCEERIPLCGAACCRLPFALSKQDVYEGIVRWELGQPYWIEHDADGYCHHMERGSCRCTIYRHRPIPCRAFDCRNDDRIWLDFDQMIPNPALEEPDWPRSLVESEKDSSP